MFKHTAEIQDENFPAFVKDISVEMLKIHKAEEDIHLNFIRTRGLETRKRSNRRQVEIPSDSKTTDCNA